MKIPSITIGTPHNRDLSPEYVMSLVNLLGGMIGKANVKLKFFQSCLVHVGRNTIGNNLKTDYLLFIDSDIMFPSWALERLLSRNKDIVGGMYFKKLPPHQPLVYVYKKNKWSYETIPNPPTQLFECQGIGTGFLLIKRKVLKDLYDKKFARKNGFPFNFIQKPDGNDIGEDLAFCIRARKKGYKIWCDPSIPLLHIGDARFGSKDQLEIRHSEGKIEYDNKIEGWMSKEELNWLFKVASGVKSVIEVGSWKGRSTHALLTGCKGIVTAIDHFKGSPGEVAHKGVKNIFRDFKKNVGHFKNLKVIKSNSLKAAKEFKGTAEMVFIDGAHTYEAVKADIEAWLPKATLIICGHDFQWPGVQKAVTEKFGFVHTQDTIWYKKLK
jgi:predicted O-methyltransferase YrrM